MFCRKSEILRLVKDVFSAFCFTLGICCYISVPSYVTCFPFTLLYYVCYMYYVINRISGSEYLYSNCIFILKNYVFVCLLSHRYDLLCLFSWLQEIFLIELEKTRTSSSHQPHGHQCSAIRAD